jgi:hypothetical protein
MENVYLLERFNNKIHKNDEKIISDERSNSEWES